MPKAGWKTWNGKTWNGTTYLGEFTSMGPGAAKRRASWVDPGTKMSSSDATRFQPKKFLSLSSWLPRDQ